MRQISNYHDLGGDLAGRYHATPTEGLEGLDQGLVEADFTHLQAQGYVILQGLLDAEALGRIRAAVDPLLRLTGRNNFEGMKTQRLYDVLSKTMALNGLIEHPRVLALVDRMLAPNYLLSQAQVINILAGEAAQMLHTDDSFYLAPRPRPPLGMATIWAIDEFTAENGATVVIPRSHLWGDEREPRREDTIPCVMPAGSVVLFMGTLWHGGGANATDKPRLAVTSQYCQPWLRQQENYTLGVSREVARQLPENILRMIGYSIHPPFIGMVNGMHPKRLLE